MAWTKTGVGGRRLNYDFLPSLSGIDDELWGERYQIVFLERKLHKHCYQKSINHFSLNLRIKIFFLIEIYRVIFDLMHLWDGEAKLHQQSLSWNFNPSANKKNFLCDVSDSSISGNCLHMLCLQNNFLLSPEFFMLFLVFASNDVIRFFLC